MPFSSPVRRKKKKQFSYYSEGWLTSNEQITKWLRINFESQTLKYYNKLEVYSFEVKILPSNFWICQSFCLFRNWFSCADILLDHIFPDCANNKVITRFPSDYRFQFHQHFTSEFFGRKCFENLFFACIFLAKEYWQKSSLLVILIKTFEIHYRCTFFFHLIKCKITYLMCLHTYT
jgi:hypothetical protein